ncbi:hypothetical protein HKW90_03800 [Pseudomonas aeruginosa]|nr:hypothetical protein [Pseudomonas aeruginosa]
MPHASQTQLEQILDSSNTLTVGHRSFSVSNIRREGELGLFATFKTKRAEYIAMASPKTRVIGRPNAEVWAVMSLSGHGRKIVDFAVDQGRVLVLA